MAVTMTMYNGSVHTFCLSKIIQQGAGAGGEM
jgi:hypothetical protein